jgi:hypothetical protein
MDYFQNALQTFNGGDWYGWKTHDENGNKIPNEDRMQYQHIKIIKDGATMPTEAEVNAKIEELKQDVADKETKKTSGKAKLKSGEALTDAEIKALFGDN